MEGTEYFVGAVVSLVVEGLKKQFGTGTFGTLVIVTGLSLVAAVASNSLLGTSGYETLAKVLVTAGAFHNFILKRF